MSNLGKVDREFFESVIYPNLGSDRDDVVTGPRHGVDFGVLDVGGRAMVLATDPLSILPQLGFERAGRLAIDVVLADVAVSGISPTHLTVSLSLPPAMTDDELEAAWTGIADRAKDLDVSIVTGHTARYSGIDFSWVGAATAIGVGTHDDVVRPDGARPGDAIVVGTGPGAEVAGLFAALFPDSLELSPDSIALARERLEDIPVVEDAIAAGRAGRVTAMHDATEGGLHGALVEMASGANVRFDVDADAVPVGPGVERVFDAIDIDPWQATSSGTLVVTVDPDDAPAVVDALHSEGTRAAIVGSVSEGDGAYVDDARLSPAERDPSWEAFARLTAE